MSRSVSKTRRVAVVLALLLTVVFLGAQLHFCADLSDNASTHLCPVCSAVGSAIVTSSAGITVVSSVTPLASTPYALLVSPQVLRATSPRAPPAS